MGPVSLQGDLFGVIFPISANSCTTIIIIVNAITHSNYYYYSYIYTTIMTPATIIITYADTLQILCGQVSICSKWIDAK